MKSRAWSVWMLGAALAFGASSQALCVEPADIRVGGLATPECVLHDTESDVYLVSNIAGSPLEKDGNGFISRVAPDGKVKELRWIDGAAEGVTLHAPKGMAIVGGTLFVSDIDVVRLFDRKTGAPKGEVSVDGALFLNDIAPAPGGGVLVTDSGLTMGASGLGPSGRAAVYGVDVDGGVKTVVKGEKYPALNGVASEGERILLVSFDTNELAEVKDGALATLATTPKGGLDGLARLPDGRWAVSSWEGQAVYAGPLQGPFVPLVEGVPSPADIGVDLKRGRLLVPNFTGDEVLIRTIAK